MPLAPAMRAVRHTALPGSSGQGVLSLMEVTSHSSSSAGQSGRSRARGRQHAHPHARHTALTAGPVPASAGGFGRRAGPSPASWDPEPFAREVNARIVSGSYSGLHCVMSKGGTRVRGMTSGSGTVSLTAGGEDAVNSASCQGTRSPPGSPVPAGVLPRAHTHLSGIHHSLSFPGQPSYFPMG